MDNEMLAFISGVAVSVFVYFLMLKGAHSNKGDEVANKEPELKEYSPNARQNYDRGEDYYRHLESMCRIAKFSSSDFHQTYNEVYHYKTSSKDALYILPFAKQGAMSYLLGENLKVYSANGFHRIYLLENKASIGAREYVFRDHIDFIESGMAESFRVR